MLRFKEAPKALLSFSVGREISTGDLQKLDNRRAD